MELNTVGVRFENWNHFVGYVAEQVKVDKFQDFLVMVGIDKSEIISLWQTVNDYDWDNLELGEWLGFKLMFSDAKIFETIQQQSPLIELFTCRLLIREKILAFYMAGESICGTQGFDCYSFGFIDGEQPEHQYFVCLVEREEKMVYIVGTQQQYKKYYNELKVKIPGAVLDLLYERTALLDENYGGSRDMEKDLGGFCVVFPDSDSSGNADYQKIIENYYIQPELYEYREQVGDGDSAWTETLYMLSSDYGLILFCPAELRIGDDE